MIRKIDKLRAKSVHFVQAKTEEALYMSDLIFECEDLELELSLHFERLIEHLGWIFIHW